jgi:TolB-like protein
MSSVYEFGPFRLDSAEGVLLRNGEPVRLMPKTLDMLRVLVENRGRLLHKDELMKLVWPDSFVDEGNLSHHVFSLRKALGDERGSTTYIETVPKRGYRFVGEVRPITGLDRLPTARSGLVPRDPASSDPYSLAAPRIESLAVLPLTNMSETPEQDYLVDGITEALISDLASIPTLRVISRTSAMRYRDTQKTLPEIAQELNIEGIVAGSVLRVGDRVRISIELIHGATDAHLWGNSYDEAIGDVLALQRDVTRAIAEEIKGILTPHERARLARFRAVAPAAHEAYLKGRYYYGKATEEGFRRAVEHLQIAIDADPNPFTHLM